MPSKYYLPAFLWAIVILILTMMPGKYIPPVNIWDLTNIDKLAHLFVFAVLMVLLLYGFQKQTQFNPLPFRMLLIAFFICVSYGLLIEGMQGTLLTDRHFELYDALANAIGCIIGGFLFKYLIP
jgi:VanZ family protein